jgi:hypothetical protein
MMFHSFIFKGDNLEIKSTFMLNICDYIWVRFKYHRIILWDRIQELSMIYYLKMSYILIN